MDSVFGLCVCICEAVWGPVVRVVAFGPRGCVHRDVLGSHVCRAVLLCVYVVTPRVLLTCVPSLAPSADGILKHILRLKVAADRVSLDVSLARLNENISERARTRRTCTYDSHDSPDLEEGFQVEVLPCGHADKDDRLDERKIKQP